MKTILNFLNYPDFCHRLHRGTLYSAFQQIMKHLVLESEMLCDAVLESQTALNYVIIKKDLGRDNKRKRHRKCFPSAKFL